MPRVTDEEAHEIQKNVERANDRQVGGNHYRDAANGGQQHWDRAWQQYREAWFVLNITKYVERYRIKDGMKDLLKAKHYLEKLIELEEHELVEWQKKQATPSGLPTEQTDPKEYD